MSSCDSSVCLAVLCVVGEPLSQQIHRELWYCKTKLKVTLV